MTLAQAKQYIYRELQELPVQSTAPAMTWEEHPDCVVVRLAEMAVGSTTPVELDAGVREVVVGSVPESNGTAGPHPIGHTATLEFDRSAGWDRTRAAQWLHRHLGGARPGTDRLARRAAPDGCGPGWFSLRVLAPHKYRCGPAVSPPRLGTPPANGLARRVEFVAVPPTPGDREGIEPRDGARHENGHRVGAPARPRLPRGGAGLELDLTDFRQRDRVPPALRATLPAHGVVNLDEAQVIIRLLKAWQAPTMAPPPGPVSPSSLSSRPR